MTLTGDILIKDGTVIQPEVDFCGKADVLISDGCIKAVLKHGEPAKASKTFHADNCIVTPGLIDFHTHLFNGGSEIGVNPDAFLFPQGVTAAVDQGTSGLANVDSFYKDVVAASEVKVFAFLNVSSSGLTTLPRCFENLDPDTMDLVKLQQKFSRYHEKLIGLKVRTSEEIVGDYGYRPLQRARELADAIHCPIAVHTTNAPGTHVDLLSRFKKGDIYAHMYQGRKNSIVNAEGHVDPAVWEARKRGVLFDTADGRDHYRFTVTKRAMREGFLPDIISTDLVRANVFDKAVFGLPLVLSKYLALGLPLPEAIKKCTVNPAKVLKKAQEIGTFREGSVADVSIFKLENLPIQMRDVFGDHLDLDRVLITKATIADGRVVFAQLNYSPYIEEYR
jgi:predicted amidohydrolase